MLCLWSDLPTPTKYFFFVCYNQVFVTEFDCTYFVQAKYGITADDFVCCHSVRNSRMWQDHKFEWQFNYFFAKEVTEEEFLAIERGCLDSKDHGQEVIWHFLSYKVFWMR